MKHIHPSRSSKQAWRKTVLRATSTNLPSEHSWSLSSPWMPRRSLPLKSRKKLKEVLCGSAGNRVYLLPLGKSLLGCFPLFLSLHVLRSYFISRRDHRFLAFSWSLVWYFVTCYSAFSSLHMGLYCEECKWIILKYLANIRWQNDHNCLYLALREPLTVTSGIVYKEI